MARAITCNGASVLTLRLLAPIAAAWVADVEASIDSVISGAVTLTDGDNAWQGTVLSSGTLAGICSMLIVGGKGGLQKELGAKSYVGTVARQVVQDIAADAGETLSQKALTAPALRSVLRHWTRVGNSDGEPMTAGAQLTSVLDAVGATWRVQPNGQIWIGSPSFVTSKPTGLMELHRDPARGRVHVELDALDLLPDTNVAGNRVGDVEYRVADAGIKATYWLEAA
jgi:hypothetical protein